MATMKNARKGIARRLGVPVAMVTGVVVIVKFVFVMCS